MKLRIYRFLEATEVEGPGRRACLWVQGCSIRCRGCFNPHTWRPDLGREVDAHELGDRITATAGIEGLTLLGGEPFDQAEALAGLARRVRAVGLSVMTFTGYTLEQLRAGSAGPGVRGLLAATDLLVDGPYVAELPDHRRPWVGSRNQRFHFLTPRYRHLAATLEEIPDRLEIRLRPDGSVWWNGQCADVVLKSLRRELGLRPRSS